MQSKWNRCCSKATGEIFLKSEDNIKFNFFFEGISSKSLIIKMSSFSTITPFFYRGLQYRGISNAKPM